MPVAAAIETVVRDLRPEDWARVAAIYRDGMRDGLATFETEVPTWEAWDAAHLPEHRFVAEQLEEVVGWIAVSPTSSRRAYRGVVEHSVYVAREHRGEGIGRALLERLVESTEAAGIWSIVAGIFPENEASLKLHHAVGFRVVGVHKRVAKRDGLWRDTVLMERRSEVVE